MQLLMFLLALLGIAVGFVVLPNILGWVVFIVAQFGLGFSVGASSALGLGTSLLTIYVVFRSVRKMFE